MSVDTHAPGDVTLDDDDRAAALAAVKARLRLTAVDDDALVVAFVETALGLAEQFTGRVLIVRPMTLALPVVSGWQHLGASPVRAITGVAGLADDGQTVALPVVGYATDIDARGQGWVRVTDAGGAGRVQVMLSAGIADGWQSLPAAIREGVLMLAAYLYNAADTAAPPPSAITALWRPYRAAMLSPAGHA